MPINLEDRTGASDEVALVYDQFTNIRAKLKFGIGQGKDFRSAVLDILPASLTPTVFGAIGDMSKAVLLEQWTLNYKNSSEFDVPTLANSDKQALLVKVSGFVDSIGERVVKNIVIPYYDTSRDMDTDANYIKSLVRISGADNTGVSDIRVDSYSIIRQQ